MRIILKKIEFFVMSFCLKIYFAIKTLEIVLLYIKFFARLLHNMIHFQA